ncbi:amino acid ABC transporter permease [Prosthecodimorpha staleyi]|uniref:Amino acid ABC transporter permease n=1 Tax=Prosthecodimorpha staleyi TaxID=2840188 RepID=A0A947D9Q8_9HYPH|nr:amino acid ABC transporter permease [Prosthecodimorpha staleyi]MBT9292301.1 amino acid ABC transporter permease [Prosthecodimorpha staleyi]
MTMTSASDTAAIAFVRREMVQAEPPPPSLVGMQGWLKKNLFSTPGNVLLTAVGFFLAAWLIWQVVDFAIVRAVFVGTSGEDCRKSADVGACWPYVQAYWKLFVYGRYPIAERWRVDLTGLVFVVLLVPLMIPAAPLKRLNVILFFVIFPVFAFSMLVGGWFGLVHVETALWGGVLVSLVVAVTGIVMSLPLGVLLALGRRSKMPVIRLLSTIFIEFWRGVPLITVLFMASNMLPLFMPAGVDVDKLLRALIGVSLFSAAYMAEVVRGGLQAIPKGQYEGAMALGLSYWRMMGLVVMPQALKLVIPGIVNTFIGLFKDTTLVSIVSIFDLLGMINFTRTDSAWAAPTTAMTGYLVAAIFYWVFCFGMSRYSMFMENRLNTGHKH